MSIKFACLIINKLSFLQLSFAGIYIPESSHYYYPNFRTQGRFPADKKSVLEELNTIHEIDEEERSTVRQRMSRDTGYTGLSILHRLYPLYGFLYDESTVYDEMHTISLNVVKNALLDLRIDSRNGIDWSKVDDRLNQIPWPSGMSSQMSIVFVLAFNRIFCLYIIFGPILHFACNVAST